MLLICFGSVNVILILGSLIDSNSLNVWYEIDSPVVSGLASFGNPNISSFIPLSPKGEPVRFPSSFKKSEKLMGTILIYLAKIGFPSAVVKLPKTVFVFKSPSPTS